MKANLSIFNFNRTFAFILKSLVFLLLFLLLDRSVGALLGLVYRQTPHGSNWTKVKWMLDEQFDVVIFGSSRAFRHYVPQVISREMDMSVFNAGQNGQYLLYSYAVEQLLLERYAPKIIVLDVAPNFIVKLPNPDEEFERLASLSPYIDNKEVKRLLTREKFFEGLKFSSKTYRYNSKILSILDNIRVGAGAVDNGFEKIGMVKFHRRNPFLVDTIEKIEIDSFKLDLLQRFVASARERGVQVYAAFSPVAQPLSDKVAYVMQKCEQLFYDLNTPFLNFARPMSSDYPDKELFMDFIHMNEFGARSFSKDFAVALTALRDAATASEFVPQ